jgi:hypothetical protein
VATIFASKAVVTSVGGAIGGGTSNSTQPVVTGTAAAGTYVYVYDGVRMIGTATVAANGTWSFTVPASLKGGNHSFTAIDVGSDGNYGGASTPMSVIIPTSAPVVPPKPVINGMTDDQGHPLSNPTNDAHPNMSGTGVAGDTITVYDGNKTIGSTTIGPDGKWTFKPSPDLSNGSHDIYVIETSPAGVPSKSAILHLVQHLIHNLFRRERNIHLNGFIRTGRFERIELALQERRIEEMTRTRLDPFVQQFRRSLQIYKRHVLVALAKNVAIHALQRRTRIHVRGAVRLLVFYRCPDGRKPGPAVVVRERNALVHLVLVRLTMKTVGIGEIALQPFSQHFADRRLATTGYAHRD